MEIMVSQLQSCFQSCLIVDKVVRSCRGKHPALWTGYKLGKHYIYFGKFYETGLYIDSIMKDSGRKQGQNSL